VIGVKPNPNWLPLTLFFGVPGPFTVEVTQFSSMVIGYYVVKKKVSSMAKCLLASLAFNATISYSFWPDSIKSNCIGHIHNV
jgi:hypothetical protein